MNGNKGGPSGPTRAEDRTQGLPQARSLPRNAWQAGIAHQKMVQEALKKKFGSHQRLICKYDMRYPEQAEREYQRLASVYMRLVMDALKEYLPEIRDAAKAERESSRRDAENDRDDPKRQPASTDLIAWVNAVFDKMAAKLEQDTADFGFYERVQKLANLTERMGNREWKKAVRATLGIDLMEDYYKGEFFREALPRWVEQNVALVKTIPQESLGKMRHITLEGYRNGESTTTIVKKIQAEYGMDKRHARLIARDQIAKLNSQIVQQRMRDAGVREYFWRTVKDRRVRDSHRELEGKRFRLDDPPVVDQKTGRRCHPGEDFQCRCTARAVFDWETIDLPISEERKKA